MANHRLEALNFASNNANRFLNDLKEISSIPSISTDPGHKEEIRKAAEWITNELRSISMDNVKIYPTGGHPVVFGESLSAGADKPTVLIYGHYDVQPAEPLDEWDTPPFNPVVRDEYLIARGASDMKGQVVATIKAVESIMSTYGQPDEAKRLPINVKFLIEGEEEIGSPNLGKFIEENKKLLSCDFALNTDTGMVAQDMPTITYALRGLAYFEIRIHGPSHDLHSGLFGGTIHNPAQVLCDLISGMHDKNGKITLPGYYDRVRVLTDDEREEISRLPKDDNFYLDYTGVPALWGEVGYSPEERVGGRPSLEVNGIISGFTGKGSKTVLPAYAMAKISTRLVPDQDPEEVHQQLLKYMHTKAPPTITWEVIKIVSSPASLSNRNSKWVQAYAKAAKKIWNVNPIYKRDGGSVPVVLDFQKILGVDCLNTGFGLPSDNVHGPNERLHLPTWQKGIQALINLFFNLS